MNVKLVYNGVTKVSFIGVNTELNPGDEFYVPEGLVTSFTQRGDVFLAKDKGADEVKSEPASKKSTNKTS